MSTTKLPPDLSTRIVTYARTLTHLRNALIGAGPGAAGMAAMALQSMRVAQGGIDDLLKEARAIDSAAREIQLLELCIDDLVAQIALEGVTP